jgi:hypothetical protein
MYGQGDARFKWLLVLYQECDQLRLSVPGLCLGVPGKGLARRCKWLINKLLEYPAADEKSVCRFTFYWRRT